jgi:molybdenum cofactor cytidylyltransferase
MRLSGILLAAGAARRFGGDKLMQPLPSHAHGVAAGTPIAIAALMHVRAVLDDCVVVAKPIRSALHDALDRVGAETVLCANADEGMGRSLACGVAARPDADGWIVALADMPWIEPASIIAVADALRAGASIAATRFDGARGHPVGFARRHRDALLRLRGDEGARTVVEAHRADLVLVDVADAGVVRDVDVPADLKGGAGG